MGIAESKETFYNLEVYPNPSNGKISLMITSPINSRTSLEVYSAIGQRVYNESLAVFPGANKRDLELDIEDGIYFIVINNDHGSLVEKISITK